RQGRAEEGHDAVSHHLIDRPFIVMDGFHHSLEDGIQQLPRLLGIPVGEQLHRALEVGEEHRDLLALTFESGPGHAHALSDMLWGVGLWDAEARGRGLAKSTWMGALGAELRDRGKRAAAIRARAAQR